LGNRTSYGIIAPLVSGVTSIIDEAEFDAEMVFYTEAKVTTWYTAPTAIRRLMRMEDIKPKEVQSENLRSILSVGEPLNAEAVIWVRKILDSLLWTIGGKRKREVL
jgi:acetyl-CoA synthetase